MSDSPDVRATTLPFFSTVYFGRENEQERLIDLLLRDETRLVTLLGPGGIGKTRLAVAVAETIVERGNDEALFVDLASATDSQRMLEVLASALHVADDSSAPIEQRIGDALRARVPLVILDNMEQIPDAASAISRLLALCPGVSFLATSRIPVRVSGERQFPVAPLLSPEVITSATREELKQHPAVALFVDRAQAVRPDFALTDENIDDVVALCARVDGLPLAIELAATRLLLFSPAALLAGLDDHLGLLSRGPVDRPERQRTMHQAIAWSTNLLDAEELSLLHAVSTFEGSFCFNAAQAVSGRSRAETAHLLSALVDKSLLQAMPIAGDDVRFRLLQTVRDVVRETVDAEGRRTELRKRHAAYYAALAADVDAGLMGEDQSTWVERAEAEYENLRSAMSWFFDQQDAPAAVSFVASMWPFWYGTGRLAEGRHLLSQALNIPGTVDLGERARALNGLGALFSALGDYDSATTACESALDLWRQSGNLRSVGNALNNLGTLAERHGKYAEAIHLYDEALEIFTGLDDRFRTAAVLTNIANVSTTTRDLERARTLHQRALGIRRALIDANGIAQSLHNLGVVLDGLRDHQGAEHCYTQALPLFEELADPRMVSVTLNSLGANARDRGNAVESELYLHRALDIAREISDPREEATALRNLGLAARLRQDSSYAMQAFRESLETSRRSEDPVHALATIEQIADLALEVGDATFAATLLAYARKHSTTSGSAARELDEKLNRLKSRLAASDFNRASEDGRASSFIHVVDLALAFDPLQPRPSGGGTSVHPPTKSERASTDHDLTARELDVLRLVAEGRTNAEIGDALFISPFTAKTHVANLLGKLAVDSRAAAATWAARHGVI